MPYTLLRVAIPPGASVASQFDILSQRSLAQIDVLPAVVVNGLRGETHYPRDENVYQSAVPYPGEIVIVSEPYLYRRMQVVDLRIYPVQYHPSQHQLQLMEKITIHLQLKGGESGVSISRLSKAEKFHLNNQLINRR